ncbi:hypothetical protein GCM10027429_02870 [Marivirga atlantica]|uniref:Uncharacterized protein n=1 Tax=Marivirga atlantica TaxID=1548457 RepID=A0A937AE20_9BACT|nr:hypothetical protein [Marivirga atlantica]MBL0763899.1 hypothetical protein [Marivirga atlantica]
MSEIVFQTSIKFDLNKSNFNSIIKAVKVPKFNGPNKYLDAHNWIKKNIEGPYYFNSYQNLVYHTGKEGEEKSLEENFPDCIKLLFNKYSYDSIDNNFFKSSYRPYILVKSSSQDFIQALELDITHDYKKGNVILIEDHAVTFRRVRAKDAYYREEIYIPRDRKNFFQLEQLRSKKLIHENALVFQKYSNNKNRSHIDFIDPRSFQNYESTRSKPLWSFIRNMLDYFNSIGIEAYQYNGIFNKKNTQNYNVDLSTLEFEILDKRMNKAEDFPAKLITNTSKANSKLILLDYTKDGIENIGKKDKYPEYKKDFKISHVLNVNSNNSDSSDYFNYNITADDLVPKIEIIKTQLFLKEILFGSRSTSYLPLLEKARSFKYIYKNVILEFKNDEIEIQPLLESDELDILLGAYVDFVGFNVKSIPKDRAFLINTNTNTLIMISPLKKKFLYPDKTNDFLIREEDRNINEWKIEGKEEFNQYLDNNLGESFSFEDLLKHKTQIYEILNIKKSTSLQKIYNIPGKKKGLGLHQGIWFDKENMEYFSGLKHAMNIKQSKSHKLRRIDVLSGVFDEEKFFSLMNVDFIRSSGSPILPYPFGLINIFLSEREI